MDTWITDKQTNRQTKCRYEVLQTKERKYCEEFSVWVDKGLEDRENSPGKSEGVFCCFIVERKKKKQDQECQVAGQDGTQVKQSRWVLSLV